MTESSEPLEETPDIMKKPAFKQRTKLAYPLAVARLLERIDSETDAAKIESLASALHQLERAALVASRKRGT